MTTELPENPAGWTTTRLGSVSEFVMGQAPPGKDCNKAGEGTPFVKAGEFGVERPVIREWTTKPLKCGSRDDIFICVVGATAGKLNLGEDCAIGRSVAAIRPSLALDQKYGYFQLIPHVQRMRRGSVGSAQGVISKAMLDEVPVALAPEPEQHRIVEAIEAHFSRLDAAVAALKRVQANLKRYRASVLKAACEGRLVPTEAELARKEGRDYEPASKLLERILNERRKRWNGRGRYVEPAPPDGPTPTLPDGWTVARAEQVCHFITKGTTPHASKLHSGSGEVPYIKVYNLTFSGALDFSINPTFVGRTTHAGELKRSQIFPGDVLMNIVGPPLGKVSVVPPLHQEWNTNQAVAIFRPMHPLSSAFVSVCLRTKDTLDWATKRAKATAGQFNLTLEICRDLPLPMPPLAEQARIVAEVERRLSVVDELETSVAANLKRAERLRQAILKRAFEGRLVPTEHDLARAEGRSYETAEQLLARIKANREAKPGEKGQKKDPVKQPTRKRPAAKRRKAEARLFEEA